MQATTTAASSSDLSSVNNGVLRAQPRNLDSRTSTREWLPPAIASLILIALLYGSILLKLVRDWFEIPDTSHGILIPFFVSFVLWTNRTRLAATEIVPCWSGLLLVGSALLVLIIGVFGADLFLSRFSLVLLVSGVVLTAFGPKIFRQLTFVWFVSLLAIPLPAVVLNQITFPLQLFASQMASWMLALAGVPVLREGNVIQLPAMQLEVAEACSGIRSLVSLFTMALVFGYLFERRVGRRAILAACSIPIAVFANAIRIFGTGLCVQYWDPEKAMGFFHEFSGWLMFLVSLCCLYIVHRLTKQRRQVLA